MTPALMTVVGVLLRIAVFAAFIYAMYRGGIL